jgi:hypothetical protein
MIPARFIDHGHINLEGSSQMGLKMGIPRLTLGKILPVPWYGGFF